MAIQPYGNQYQVVFAPDGSIIITTTDELIAADSLEFGLEFVPGPVTHTVSTDLSQNI